MLGLNFWVKVNVVVGLWCVGDLGLDCVFSCVVEGPGLDDGVLIVVDEML